MSVVTQLNELKLSRWAFDEPVVAGRLWGYLNLPRPAAVRFNVMDPLITDRERKPGDIDVLVCDPRHPDQAVAFECKRVKIKAETFETLQVAKLAGLAQSVHQIRGLREIGFSRCFLLIFVAVDGRERDHFNFAHRGPTPALVRCVDEVFRGLSMDAEVGVVSIELVQPTTRDFGLAGGAGIRVLRPACCRPQSSALTERVAAYLCGEKVGIDQHGG